MSGKHTSVYSSKKYLVDKHAHFLRRLSSTLVSSRKEGLAILEGASVGEIRSLLEIIANFLAGNFPYAAEKVRLVKKLRKHKTLLRSLVTKRLPYSTVRDKLVNQEGGAILTALLTPLIGALISAGVSKYV